VAAKARELNPADAFGWRRTRLGELAGDTAELHNRDARAVGQHDGHLQDDAELVSDVVGREFSEALGAVAGLEQKGAAFGDLGERLREVAGLAGEHERRDGRQLLEDAFEGGLVRPGRLLLGREVSPTRG
jgi:hypothetical protein